MLSRLEQVFGPFEVCVFGISTAGGRRLVFTVVKGLFSKKEKRRTEPVVGALKSELFFEGTSDLRNSSENVLALIFACHHPW